MPADFCSNGLYRSDGYGDLVRCVMDAVGSIGVRYQAVVNGLEKFDTFCRVNEITRPTTPKAFLDQFSSFLDDQGEWLATRIWNFQRTSTRSGILKTEAMVRMFRVLVAHGIETTNDLLVNVSNREVRRALEAIPGQSEGVSISYLFMLAGYRDGVKDDRMIARWFDAVLGVSISTGQKAIILIETSRRLATSFPCADAKELDHFIWRYESTGNTRR